MGKTKVQVERFADLGKLKKRLSENSDEYYFRGMASSDWRLKTSIDRLIEQIRKTNSNPLLSDTNQNTFAEILAQSRFIKSQSQNLNRLFGRSTSDDFLLDNDTFLHMPIILQHYGYPTRVQDWTESWKIAIFFCLEDSSQAGDVCIWTLKKGAIPDVEACLDDESFLYDDDFSKSSKISAFYHRLKVGVYRINKGFFRRIRAQEGIALTTGRADDADFQQHLEECSWIPDGGIRKFVIDGKLRAEMLEFVDSEGITHDSLYPSDITDGYLSTDKAAIDQFVREMYPG